MRTTKNPKTKILSIPLTEDQEAGLQALYDEEYRRTKNRISFAKFVRDRMILPHLNGNSPTTTPKSVSPPEVDTDSEQLPISTNESKQKKSWGEFNLDGMYDDS
jgi:hypothetical protein